MADRLRPSQLPGIIREFLCDALAEAGFVGACASFGCSGNFLTNGMDITLRVQTGPYIPFRATAHFSDDDVLQPSLVDLRTQVLAWFRMQDSCGACGMHGVTS